MNEKLKQLQIGEIKELVDLKKYNTYRISCIAKYLIYPKDSKKLIQLLSFLKQENIPYKVLGNGSNVLFTEEIFNGAILKLDCFNQIEIQKNTIIVGAGVNLISLVNKLSNMGYTGLEFACGIPGLVGASVLMNIGAHHQEISSVVKSVKVITPDLKIKELSHEDLMFSYRNSFLKQHKEYIVIEVTLKLEKKDPKEILKTIQENNKIRNSKQPLDFPNAGSVFINPSNDSAGRIIESLGLKGKRIGGAMVSEKHANFIINTGNATGKEIYELILFIKKEVKEKYNIDLVLEQELM